VIAVGNFAEERNARGLADVLAEIERRRLTSLLPVTVVSGAGLDPLLEPFVTRSWVTATSAARLHELYRQAAVALVPARRLTGMKTTILQAWSCGVAVVCSDESAATVGAPDALLAGDDAAAMVDALTRAVGDAGLRRRLVEAGFDTLARDFDPAEEERSLQRIIGAAMTRSRNRS
jgi:glycosyltransferase involved in cell wall biosynthesis